MDSSSGGSAPAAFDRLIEAPDAGLERSTDTAATGAPPTATSSLPTLIGAFIAIALAQIVVALATPVIFDLPGTRVVLVGLLVAPAVLYLIVAAWDHRELLSAGEETAPTPLWAVLPPVYLLLRRRRVTTSAHRTRTTLGWSVAQAGFTAAFAVFAVAAVVTAPAGSAEAAFAGPAPTTIDQLEEVVEAGWADAGGVGVARCTGPVELAPESDVECTGSLDGVPLRFTATVGDSGTGDAAITIDSWSELPAA